MLRKKLSKKYLICIYQTSEYPFRALSLEYLLDVYWFAKHRGGAREKSPFQPSFEQINLMFLSLAIHCFGGLVYTKTIIHLHSHLFIGRDPVAYYLILSKGATRWFD